jgi:fructokinase
MIRIGVDFGGTKIEAAALDERGEYVARVRKPNPGNYNDAIGIVCDLVTEVEKQADVGAMNVGLGMPGSISPKTGLVRNANSTWLNNKPFDQDLQKALGRDLRVANDANCFALSEATDGGGAGAKVVFGVIIGTGCGGGLVVDGRMIDGINGVAGEWGHMPLPWPSAEERGAHRCWCGRIDCLETWVSGSAFVADYQAHEGEKLDGASIMARAREGDATAVAALDRYVDRLGRALAVLGDILDPDVIVLGGGMSNTDELYDRLPPVFARYIFSDTLNTKVVKAVHGDSSGVRGAAWLWPLEG